jgi:hypothetical protein
MILNAGGSVMDRKIFSNTVVFLVLVVFGVTAPLNVDGKTKEADWPRWRGPNGDGISTETDWDPEAFKGGPKIV